MSSRWTIAGLAFVAGLAAMALASWWSRHDAPRIPELDLAGLEPGVALQIEDLRRKLIDEPGSPVRWGELALNLDVHDLRSVAIPFYARAMHLDPGEPRWPYFGAIALQDMGSSEALAWFERAGELLADYPPFHVRQGRALADHDRWQEAVRAFESALALDPELPQAHLGLALIALAQGDVETSHEHLLHTLEGAPDHGEALGLLADVYRRLGRATEAGRILAKARDAPAETPLADPLLRTWTASGTSVFWHLKRGHSALGRGDFETAVSELEQALATEPSAQEHNNLGVALRRLGRLAEAEASFREALALEPAHGEALLNLGSVLRALGRPAEAISHAEEAVAKAPGLVEGHVNLGVLYMETQRYRDAATAFRRGLERAPDDLRLTLRLAWLLATAPQDDLRDGKKAVRLARTVCDADSRPVAAHLDVLAAALAEAGDFEEAIAIAGRALEISVAEGRRDLASQIATRAEGYRTRRPYRHTSIAVL